MKAAFYRCGSVDIEVIEIADRTERNQRLGRQTARIEHVAFEVDGLEPAMQALTRLGIKFKSSTPLVIGDTASVWTEPETCDGVMYQLLERTTSSGET